MVVSVVIDYSINLKKKKNNKNFILCHNLKKAIKVHTKHICNIY